MYAVREAENSYARDFTQINAYAVLRHTSRIITENPINFDSLNKQIILCVVDNGSTTVFAIIRIKPFANIRFNIQVNIVIILSVLRAHRL